MGQEITPRDKAGQLVLVWLLIGRESGAEAFGLTPSTGLEHVHGSTLIWDIQLNKSFVKIQFLSCVLIR